MNQNELTKIEKKCSSLQFTFKTMQNTSPEIIELKKRIEDDLNRKMLTSNDFFFLAHAIEERMRQTVSASTLKRLWGYVSDTEQPRNSTLEILSKFLGFNSWSDFVKEISRDSGSNPLTSVHINTEDLEVGDRIFVSWEPNRRCTFHYLGHQKFIVESAENSKLKVGNTFSCSLFILNEPLYLTDLIQENNPPVAFVVGTRGGLCELKIL